MIFNKITDDFFIMPSPFVHSSEIFCSPIVHDTLNVGKFHIEYARVPNEAIVHQEEIDYKHADNSIYLSASYDNKILFKNIEISKLSIGSIPYVEKMVLMIASDNFYKIYESNDNLILETEMSYPDSDWGYSIFISISHTGELNFLCIDHDEGYTI